MDVYGISAIMPILVLLTLVTLIQAINVCLSVVSDYVPLRLVIYNDGVVARLIPRMHAQEIAKRLPTARSYGALHEAVDRVLAEARASDWGAQRQLYVEMLERKSNMAHNAYSTARAYVVSVWGAVLVAALVGSHPQHMLTRAVACTVFLIMFAATAAAIFLYQQKRMQVQKYMVAFSLLSNAEEGEMGVYLPLNDPRDERRPWWGFVEVDRIQDWRPGGARRSRKRRG
jgi:hypothetical protein